MTTPVQAAQPDKSKLYSDRSARPAMLAPVWDGIPASLRDLNQWIAWELRWVDKRSCWAKVPIDVRGVSATDGYSRAKSDTPRTWTALATVRAAWNRTYGTYTPSNPDGPGFVFNGGGLVGIDGDKCRNPVTGEISSFGRDLMARFPGYWEVSPSGTGIKGIFFGSLADGKGRKFDYPEGHGVELYDRGRYFAITGRRIDGAAADVTSIVGQLPAFVAEIDQLKAARKPAKQQRAKPAADYSTSYSAAPIDHDEKLRRARMYLKTVPGAVAYQGGDNATFRAACILVLGFDLAPSQAMPLLCEWNQTCSPPWDEGWLWRKVSEADKQPGPRGDLLHAERDWQPPALGYENMTDAERDELINSLGRSIATDLTKQQPAAPVAEPEDCALFAAQDVDDDINLSGMKCPNLCPVIMSKDDRPFVVERWCGNGTTCRPCLCRRHFAATREGNAYMIRTSVATSGPENPPRVVMAALVDASVAPGTTRWGTLTNAVRDHGGERASLLTDDATGTAERLGRDPDASQFFLSENKVEEESGSARLWLLSMPAGTPDDIQFAGVSFRRVPVANAIRGWYHAVKTVPEAPDKAKRYKPHHKSVGWGDELAKEPTTVKALRPSKFGVARTRKILELIHVEAYSVQFDRRNGSDPGVGWALSGARSLAMEIWLGGVEATEVPTVSRVAELARHWLPIIPTDIGTGYRVMRVLSEHLWTCALYDITAELRHADEQDRAEAACLAEASTLYAALRDQVDRGELIPTGLLAEILA